MKKTTIITMALLFSVGAKAIEKDTLATSVPALAPENAEVAEIDRILVQSYLNHYCYSTDQQVLNAFNYTPEQVPTFSSEIVAQRMQVLDKNTPFDLLYNPTVQGFIDLYAVRRRDITSKVLGTSQLYFPMVEECLAKYDIPLEMKYLSIVESALNPTAISRAGAGGLWQFMVATGKQYGLDVTSYQDERFDAYKSTDAACRYLRFLYDTFGDWQLALAAYNSGPGNVNKAIRRSGGKKDFWSIKPFLPKETQGYVPAFIAVNYVMNHAAEYNIYAKEPLTTFFETDTISVTGRVDFNILAKVIDMPLDDIAFLNGTYKLKEVPDNGKKHYLVLPIAKMGLYMANEQLVYEQSKVQLTEPVLTASNSATENTEGKVAKTIWDTDWKTHKVKKGESLGGIADKHNVTLANLKKWNKLKSNKITPGQKLKIQTKVKRTIYEEAPAENVAEKKTEDTDKATLEKSAEAGEEENYQQTTEEVKQVENKPVPTAQYKYYTVQKGDTLFKIASAKGVSVDQIKKLNSGLRENKLAIGQKLKIKQI
ncbi:MAG: LysM peptidoglycan-binding domain-containing protein [Flavobacteriales bacterium]